MPVTKHTPGPWTTGEKDHDAPYQDIKITAGKRHTVCTVWIDDAPVLDFNAEQNANARLIASAPELLEACMKVMGAFAAFKAEFPQIDGEAECISSCRAAIAKATGGTPCQ